MRTSAPTRLSGRLVSLAVMVLPVTQRPRYARELYAELYGLTRSEQRRHAVSVLVHAGALRRALVASNRGGTVMITTTKPLRCRLHLHRWDERENPETHERYEVCELCNSYRDDNRPAPGTSAGGMFIGMSN